MDKEWNEMSYHRYSNRKNELWNQRDENKYQYHSYKDWYADNTNGVDEMFYYNDEEYEE